MNCIIDNKRYELIPLFVCYLNMYFKSIIYTPTLNSAFMAGCEMYSTK